MKSKLSQKSIRKLRSLARFMEKLPEGLFDLGTWATVGDNIPKGMVCETSIPKIAKTAEKIKKEESERGWSNECGTTCCVAGWQVVKDGFCIANDGEVYKSRRSKKSLGHAEDVARESLGLDEETAIKLFIAWPRDRNSNMLFDPDSSKDAAKRIRYLIEKGK